jgi:hypothetical protein
MNTRRVTKASKVPRFPHKKLIVGILLIIGGCLLLLMSIGMLHSFRHLWSLPLLLAGLVFLYRCIIKGIEAFYLISGLFLSLLGIFFLLINTVFPPGSLTQIWPTFMFITGISILPYGMQSSNSQRTKLAFIIPALAIIGLSLLFFPFSLGLINESFIDFALRWWPLLLILIGLILVITYFIHDPSDKSQR